MFGIGIWIAGSHWDIPGCVEASSEKDAAERLGLRLNNDRFYPPEGRGVITFHEIEVVRDFNGLKHAMARSIG